MFVRQISALCLILLPVALFATEIKHCTDCHTEAVSLWQQSDHARAMDSATKNSVLGNFSGVTVSHYSQKAVFFQRNEKYQIEFTEGETTKTYQVDYTFGHYPLQQYLIKSEGGRYQVFPFAWDSRPNKEGGQRWYPMYQQENIQPADRLHWQQPLQNWNGMCADCHSDGLKRNYLAAQHEFETQWDNINVGCQSCHGKVTESHYTKKPETTPLLSSKDLNQLGHWILGDSEKVAKWSGEKRDNSFMDTCFSCHSLRTPLTDGIQPGTAFLDQFSPTLLSQPLYHADGQIKEEVYVYGSFLQSKMYQAGVNCLDCHDSHSLKVKTTTNGLCLQCHNSEVYQQPEHLNHPLDSTAAQCVSCHMPESTFMGVDSRRDHSFSVPRPDHTKKFNTPNACSGCHQDKDTDWAVNQVKKLYGNNNPLSSNQNNYIKLQHQQQLPVAQHIAIANDKSLNEIYRASAIALLPNSVRQLGNDDIKQWVNSPLPLIRLATAQIGFLLPATDRVNNYLSLLNDKYKAIRIQAATNLISLGLQSAEMRAALKELVVSHEVSSWRGEGTLNQSIMQLNSNQLQPAITSLQHSIKVDPYFVAAYVNLSDIYRLTQESIKEREIFVQGLKANPSSGLLHYSFALYQIRQQQKPAALKSLSTAIKLEPGNVQYAYVYFIALDSSGKTNQALAKLKKSLPNYNNSAQLIELGLSFAQKLKDQPAFNYLLKLSQQN